MKLSLRKLWHRHLGHGSTDNLCAYKILLDGPTEYRPYSTYYWHVRCERCEQTLLRLGVPEENPYE